MNSTIICRIINSDGEIIQEETFTKDEIEIGNCIPVGSFSFDLSGILKAQKLTFEVSIQGHTISKTDGISGFIPEQEEIDNG